MLSTLTLSVDKSAQFDCVIVTVVCVFLRPCHWVASRSTTVDQSPDAASHTSTCRLCHCRSWMAKRHSLPCTPWSCMQQPRLTSHAVRCSLCLVCRTSAMQHCSHLGEGRDCHTVGVWPCSHYDRICCNDLSSGSTTLTGAALGEGCWG